jgi:peptidyl-prolyl cis-trans isomerase C
LVQDSRAMRLRLVRGLALAGALSGVAFAADQPALVTVGPESLSAKEVAERLSRVPSFQLARFGTDPEAARKGYVDRVLVPELLFAVAGEEQKLFDRPEIRDRLRDADKDALERALRSDPALKAKVTDESVKSYFESNRARFETPKRIRIWRILVDDAATAQQIIADAQGKDGPKRWSQLARDKSLDKATALRNGDLGFVRPDGTTDAPRVQVDAALFTAADKLKDGEVSPAPVPERGRFAVVWRRGSMPEVKRTLKDEEGSIRALLERRETEDARRVLLESLKKTAVKEVHPELLEHIDTAAFGPPPKRKVDKDRPSERRRPDLKRPPQAREPAPTPASSGD